MSTCRPVLRKKNVFVVIDMSTGISAREVLSGIFTFANTGRPWSTLRERTFRRTVEARGRDARTFDGGSKHPSEAA